VKLRIATAIDAEELADLFSDSRRLLNFLPELHSRQEDQAYIRDQVLGTMRVTVAEDDAGLAGFIAETDGWIEHLYLAPHRRRNGTGSLLVAAAKRHQSSLDLWCFADNVAACAFYERHGFVAAERTDGSGNEAGCPDVRYRWTA
jgi:GNAT superfamily N-acetyltransferase